MVGLLVAGIALMLPSGLAATAPSMTPAKEVDVPPLDLKITWEGGLATERLEFGIYAYSWGISSPAMTGTGAQLQSSPPRLAPLIISREFDYYSTIIARHAALGSHASKVILFGTNAEVEGSMKPTIYLQITLSDVLVTSYALSGVEGGGEQFENFELTYSKIEFKALPDFQNAPTPMTWDMLKNRA